MKKGFTLAEVLVAIGIVGVVAAITLPTLFNDAASKQIGPSLAKAVSSFEHATKSMLMENDISAISDLGLTVEDLQGGETFFEHDYLGGFLNIDTEYCEGETNGCVEYDAAFGDIKFHTLTDGIAYAIISYTDFSKLAGDANPHNEFVGDCIIDINGKESPNLLAQDLFIFELMNDGSLKPMGSGGSWKDKCAIGELPKDARYCSGHVVENNWQVLYK